MSSSTTPRPQSANTPSAPQPPRTTIYFHKVPSIKIVVPPKGRFSPQPDERCFTYCSQSIRGRIEQTEPWCRSICIRRVFDHEVRRTLAVHSQDPHIASAASETEAKFPLPPEGQPSPETHSTSPQSSEGQEWDDDIQWTPSSTSSGPLRPQNTRYWKTGWYFWYSKSRWAAQEKMDLMMCDLTKQAEWQKYKERVNAEWAAYEQKTRTIGDQASEDLGPSRQAVVQPPMHVPSSTQTAPTVSEAPIPPQVGPPFPDVASEAILLPLPPPLTAIEVPLRNLFAPTIKLLSLTHQTVVSGQQQKLAVKLWDKAQTYEPFTLARNSVMKVWQALKDHSDSEDEARRDRNS